MNKSKVFLSYPTPDSKKVDAWRAYFERDGLVECYMYERDYDAAEDSIPREIGTKITKWADYFIIFWSANAKQRAAWLLREFNIAHEKQMQIDNQEGYRFIYIVRLDDTPLPEEMNGFQYCKDNSADMDKIYQAVSKLPPSPKQISSKPIRSKIEDHMTRNPVCIHEDTTIEHAYMLMDTYHFRHLIVIDEQERMVGFVSKRDILKEFPPPRNLLPEDALGTYKQVIEELARQRVIMTPFHQLIYKYPDDHIKVALEIFTETHQRENLTSFRISAMPIVDPNNERRAVGILSYIDLLCSLPLPDERISAYMTPSEKIITVGLDDTFEHCQMLMAGHDIRHLVVVDDKRQVLGIIDDHMILRITHPSFVNYTSDLKVERFYIPLARAQCLSGNETLEEAVNKIFCRNKKETGVLIVATDGKLKGLVSYVDVLKAILQNLANNEH